MLPTLRSLLNRPLAENFDARTQFRLSLQSGLYVFLLAGLLNGAYRGGERLVAVVGLSLGCVATVSLANIVLPRLLPVVYDEDRWTVGRHSLHTLVVLLLISSSNELILEVLGIARPSFGKMYLIVTSIGLFPIMLGVFIAEQRRLKRHLAQAQVLNQQLDRHPTSPDDQPNPLPGTMLPQPIVQLMSENGRERLSLSPNQLRYVESVDNYVQVHWLDDGTAQKTVLRSTLKGIESALGQHPQFFRCHRAFVVNLLTVVHADGNARGYQLTLDGVKETIPVSRSFLSAFDGRLKAQSRFPIRP